MKWQWVYPSRGGTTHGKQDYIARILAETTAEGHLLQLQANYIVCQKCGVRVLKNAAREKIQHLHESACWYGPWTPSPQWTGNPSHILWRKGRKVYCQHCKSYAVNRQEGWQASRQLQRPCTADTAKQTQLPICFRARNRPDES